MLLSLYKMRSWVVEACKVDLIVLIPPIREVFQKLAVAGYLFTLWYILLYFFLAFFAVNGC